VRVVAAAALLALAASAIAQTFPSKPLRLIVPQPPGGGFDMVARTVAEPFAAQLGQPVVVENRPGGGTLIGTDLVAKSDADGYTLLLGASANLALSNGLYRKLPYDPKADFVPVGLAATFSYTLVARNDLPQRTLADIVGLARTSPAKLTYASAGNGTGQHICGALLWHLAGASVTHIPYKGAQAAYQDARQTKLWLESVVDAIPQAVMVTDSLGFVRFANPSAQRLTGRSSRELVGQQIEKGMPILRAVSRTHKPLSFRIALDVSCYSLIAVSRGAAPLMSDGGSVVTLTYYGAERVVPHYNVMGVAKAALECSVRYLAYDLGKQKVRVNAISAGPIKTLAARGISGLSDMMKAHAERAPLQRNVDVNEVAETAVFLSSDGGAGITGETIYVDCGYNIMGI